MSNKPRIRDEEKSCTGKIRYGSRNEARLAIVGLVTRPRRQRHHNLHSYPCRICGGYHISSKG